MPIEDVGDLREHIELAIQVELSTIPPYLYSMYSIEDQESEAALLIRSIVVEEMLHAALATNLLLSVGGRPRYSGAAYIPTYPTSVPHHVPELRVDLARCSVEQIENLFMRIEQPETRDAPAQPDAFETLGQFYHALEIAFETLSETEDLFSNPQAESQMADASFYDPVAFDAEDSGGLLLVEDLPSAIEAIEIIVHQGEGMSDEKWADPLHQELTHYHKLRQIHDGVSPLGPVRPVPANPKVTDFPEPIAKVADLFNATYRAAFLVMDRIFSGSGSQRQAVGVLYFLMGDVLSQLGSYLVRQDLGDGRVAAPTFEVFEFRTDKPRAELLAMSQVVGDEFPALKAVHDTFRGIDLIL